MFSFIGIKNKYSCNALVSIWLSKTKVQWKSKILLHGYKCTNLDKWFIVYLKTEDVYEDIARGVELGMLS